MITVPDRFHSTWITTDGAILCRSRSDADLAKEMSMVIHVAGHGTSTGTSTDCFCALDPV